VRGAEVHDGGGGSLGTVALHGLTSSRDGAVGVQVSYVPGGYSRFLKPVLDRVVAALLLVAFAPVILGVAVAVRLRLGSPVLLRQPRVGQNGSVIRVFKFRTMRPDRRQQTVAVVEDRRRTHKHPEDPRLVGLGRFLRKWSLDELPQLLNVIVGDMSLVGPRPELVGIVERHYEHWQHARHQVKPGLTGLWQITERGDGEMHEARHTATDLRYIEQLSLWTDVRILLLTVPAALGVRKGY
jgi:lipopolysaccharide/colanic/teichoic acid biosynthesis glycosyltransferase